MVGVVLGPLEGDAPDEPRSGSSVLVMDELNLDCHIVPWSLVCVDCLND